MRLRWRTCVFLTVVVPLSAFTLAQEVSKPEPLPEAALKTSSVAVFKNGLAFFVRQGTAKLAGGQAIIPIVPEATLGSLWLAPNDPGVSLEELVAYRYKSPQKREPDSIEELLRINVGKTVTVSYNGKDITGQVMGFTNQNSEKPPQPSPFDFSASMNAVVPAAPSRLVLLKTASGVLAMNPSFLQIVSMPEMPNLSYEQPAEAKALRFRVKGAGQAANLTMAYLQKGVGWTPSYLISLQEDKGARITMQAVLTNDVEDIAGADVVFVVGVPNFQFADMWSPMALHQSLAEFLQSASTVRDDRQPFSNAIMSQRVGVSAGAGIGGMGINPDLNTSVEEPQGAPEEDLFLYRRANVTLAKGERATYNMFAADIACEHIYEWEVTDTPRVDIYGNPTPSYSNNQGEKFTNVVWHSLRLKNSSKYPWTSGPAMVVSGAQPLSQDTLIYTPKGATTNLKMTVATDVRVDKKELEIERQPRALQRNNTYYDAITVEGTLKLKNFKTKDIRLMITRSFVGEAFSMSDGGHAEKLAEVIRQLNPTTRISWDLPVKAGEEKTITYRYKILVRS
ncbi:MAG TPA: hypothetical protein VF133_15270 [Terriglobales bacterium]